MSKYCRQLKLQLAKLSEEVGSRDVGREYEITARQIRYWSTVYQIHAQDSFLSKGKPYSQHFKISVIESMQLNNWSLGYTSAYFDLSSPGILHQWLNQYTEGGFSNLAPRKKGCASMKSKQSQPKNAKQMTEQEMREE